MMRALRRLYRPVLAAALSHIASSTRRLRRRCCSPARWSLARGIGSEFMPPLNEGDLMFMPIADPSISLEENTRIAAQQNAALHDVPGSRSTSSPRSARADTSTDPAPLNMTETIVHLKPRDAVARRA